jgi:hypothetical protein
LPGLVEEAGVETGNLAPVISQADLEGGIERPLRPAVAPVPAHRSGIQVGRKLRDQPGGVAAQKGEANTVGGQPIRQRGQRMVQPPFQRAAKGATVAAFIKHIDAGHWCAERGSMGEGGIVGNPEVVAEPDKRRICAHRARNMLDGVIKVDMADEP